MTEEVDALDFGDLDSARGLINTVKARDSIPIMHRKTKSYGVALKVLEELEMLEEVSSVIEKEKDI